MTNDSKPNPQHQGAHDHENAPDQAPMAPHKAVFGLIVVLIALAALAIFGILHRRHVDDVLAKTTTELAAPTVIALLPKPGAPLDSFVLPGNVTAYTDSPIYARTSGYLTRWYFDIGARVKKGALLCEIASPEVDQQLEQAQADLATAQANANNARTQADRYTGLRRLQRCFPPGYRDVRQPGRIHVRNGPFRPGQRAAFTRAGFFRKGLCPLRWRGHRP